MKKVTVFLILLAIACLAWIDGGPLPEVDLEKAGDALITGISTVDWILICSGGGLIVIWLLRFLLIPKLTGKPLAITSCVLIGVASSATTLIAMPGDWLSAIKVGVVAGIAAGKAWDLIPEKVTDFAEKPIKKRAAKKKKNTGEVGANDEVID